MFDFLNIDMIKDDNCMEGSYYARKPKTSADHAVWFSYSTFERQSSEYGKIMGSLRSDPSRTAIRTNENCKWKAGGYIVTQDGLLWIIESVGKEMQNEQNKEALRVLSEAVDTEYILRLLIQDNPWGLE